MSEPLDRPVWSALTSSQAQLAVATGAAVRIDPAYGPFAAACDASDEAQAALIATLRGPDDCIGVVEREAWPTPSGTRVLGGGDLVQMVLERLADAPDDPRVVPLGENDVLEMAELALATEPGPWSSGTHRYGQFYGIRIGGRLAAMAGERMRVPGFVEVSGVCTWPEFRGQGLAAALIRRVARGLIAHGDTPFLHSYAANVRAIALYESLGFRTRAGMTFTILALA